MPEPLKQIWGIIGTAVVSASLVVSAVIVRSGLVAVAAEVRNKPLPNWPDQLHIVAGDSKLNLDIANLTMRQGATTTEAKISIDNVRVTTPTTQPSR